MNSTSGRVPDASTSRAGATPSASAIDRIHRLYLKTWSPTLDPESGAELAAHLEAGEVLWAPRLGFELAPDERRFVDPRWADRRAKNISYDPDSDRIAGAVGSAPDLAALQALLRRYHRQARVLVERLLPRYAPHLSGARTSLRLQAVAGRASSWRKDDRRLHVDAFPSRPLQGLRILRVFTNINPHGQPRRWRVGEPFEDLATRFWPHLDRPDSRTAPLMALLRITRGRRSAYDQYMLRLHDAMKADTAYQKQAPQQPIDFLPDSTWLCFSDQTPHAAMSGQYLLEQTLYLPPRALAAPGRRPQAVLEQLAGRPLT